MDAKQSEIEKERLERATSETIRKDIRGTRQEMDETLDELGDRLHPRHLVDDLIELFRGDSERGSHSRRRIAHSSKRVGRSIARQIKEHPLPALLVGVAVARWIYEAVEENDETGHVEESLGYVPGEWSPEESEPEWAGKARMQRSAADFRHRAAGAASKAGERASGAASAVKAKVSEAASAAGERVSGAAATVGATVSGAAEAGWERIREGGVEGRHALNRRTDYVRERLRATSDDYPLPVGAAFLAAGVLVGLLVPRTEPEDRWMGDAADRFKDDTRAKGEDLLERGKAAATQTATSAMDEAEARGLTPSALVDKASRVTSEALKAGKETAREEGLDPASLKEKAEAVAQTAVETAKQEGRQEP